MSLYRDCHCTVCHYVKTALYIDSLLLTGYGHVPLPWQKRNCWCNRTHTVHNRTHYTQQVSYIEGMSYKYMFGKGQM